MSDIAKSLFGDALFGGRESDKDKAAKRLQQAETQQTLRRAAAENRRRASTAKTLAGANREGSLFPSDFAPSAPTKLG